MPAKTKVLFAVSTMGAGGAERQVLSILQHINRDRFAPALYLIERSGELIDQLPTDVPIFVFSERQRRQDVFYFPGRIHRQQVHDLAELLNEQQIDVLYERMYFMSMIGAAAARRRPVKRIAVIDSNPQFDLPRTAGRFRFLKRQWLRRAYLESARAVTVSQCVRRKTAQYYHLPIDAIETSLNFIDIERIARLSSEAPPSWSSDRFHVIAVGRMQYEKGFHLLINSLSELVYQRNRKQLLLHLVGSGPEEHTLRSEVQRQRLDEHVAFHGFTANPYPLLRRADLFCLSSLYEGLPTVLLEAMVCRTPLLATACECGPPEILEQGRYGQLIAPGSSAALADGIDCAITHPQRAREFVEPARTHVEAVYGRAAGIARVEALISDVAAS
jgi:glycosyltransferase involved in cell wall biosynthesis